MSLTAALRCNCGEVTGEVQNASPATVNRIICYCADCQAFVHHLRRADLLDAHGGSDIVQVAPSTLSLTKGSDRIAALRLSPKGPYRWYAGCCNTPLGNTVEPKIPFVGIVASAFETPDDVFGKPVGGIHGKYAIGGAPEGSAGINLRIIARALRLILGWRLGGRAWPHPYFDRATVTPRYPVTIITREEREALRPLCGPHPVAAS